MLFPSYKKVICPYDLTEIRYRKEVRVCPRKECAQPIPPEYIKNFNRIAPCFAQLIGWSQVGKTVYLQALTARLLHMTKFWKNGFSPAPLTERTLVFFRNVKEFLADGRMPNPNQSHLHDPYIIQMPGIERWGSRSLVVRDVAGEHFSNFLIPVDQMPYLLHVPTVMLMISLHDLDQDKKYTMEELLNVYINTMIDQDRDFERIHRSVIVVLSKADLLWDELPESLQDYLVTDPFRNPDSEVFGPKRMHDYMHNLSEISDEIKSWVSHIPFGDLLVSRAGQYQIDLKFTLVSSTGGEVRNSQVADVMQPTRVLDPLFWTLEYQSRPA